MVRPLSLKVVTLSILQKEIVSCEHCARLRRHCENVARVKRAMYRDQQYWGKPVPSFGDPKARLLVIGLAPGAHGANRTGRMFTGDRSGDFLYRAMFEAGFANQPESISRLDGLKLTDAYIASPVRCAPPDNKPMPGEIQRCSEFLARELRLLRNVQAVVCLGRIATDTYLGLAGLKKSRHPFSHGAAYLDASPKIFLSFHPSQQNTSTGRLTQAMLTEVFLNARAALR
jgi:uracil-DNA glycosylase family 4